MPRLLEVYGPYSIALTVVALCLYFGFCFDLDTVALMSSTVSASSPIVGFLATALAIIYSLSGSQVVADFKKSEFYQDFISYISEAIMVNFCLMIASMSFCYYPIKGSVFLAALWLGLCAASLLTLFRFAVIFTKLLRKA